MKHNKFSQLYCDALYSRANAYIFIGKLNNAERDARQCLRYAKKTGNVDKMGQVHILQSSIYDNKGMYGLMKKYICAARNIFSQANNEDGLYLSENNMGLYYSNIGSYEKALPNFMNALHIAVEKKDLIRQAHTMTHIGLTYSDMGYFAESLKWAEKSLKKAQKSGDKQSESASHNNIAIVYQETGNTKSAFEHINRALNISRNIGDKFGMGSILNNAGAVSFYLGEGDKALYYFKESLEIRRNIGDIRGISTLLNNIGYILNEQGKMNDALAYYRECLDMKRKIGDRQGESDAMRNIGYAYMVMGDFDRSIKYFYLSIDVARHIKDRMGETESLYNLIHIASLEDNKDLVEKLHRQYCAAAEKLNDKSSKVKLMMTNALVHLCRNTDKSMKCSVEVALKALNMAKEFSSNIYKIDSLMILGRIYLALKEKENAHEQFRQALEINKQTDDQYRKGQILYFLYLSSIDISKGKRYLKESIKIFSCLGSKYWLGICKKLEKVL